MSTLVTILRITTSNELRMKRKRPKTTIEMATVPIAVSAIAMLRVKFWATSPQKNLVLPQSNVVPAPFFVVGDSAVDEAHHAPAHPIDARLVVGRDDHGRALGIDARQQRHDLAGRFRIEVAGRFVAQHDQ